MQGKAKHVSEKWSIKMASNGINLFKELRHGPIYQKTIPSKVLDRVDLWNGLRTLDEAGKVHFISVLGNHLGISKEDMKKHVVPYLKDHIFVQDSINKARFRMQGVNQKVIQSNMMEQSQKEEVEPSSSQLLDGSLSYWWPTPRKLLQIQHNMVKEGCAKGFLLGAGIQSF
ncbi:hypothetical protein HKD37_04G009995 [Glycine soja]